MPDPDMQMGYVARYFLVGWSLGFRRMYWYAADSSWGRLIHQNGIEKCHDSGGHLGCPTRAAAAWTQIHRWMVGNTMSRACAADQHNIWTCTLRKPDGTELLVLWDTSQKCFAGSCTTTVFRYPAGFSHYETLDDSTVRILSGGTVQIGYKPILLAP